MKLALKLTRSQKNPILSPTNRGWENKLVFNPGVIQLEDKIHLLYRAHGEDGIACLGYARLKGIEEVEERLPYPVFSPGEWFEPDGVEDARLVAIEGRIYMIYAGKDKDMARVCESCISISNFQETM